MESVAEQRQESFAVYLAKALIAKKGYRPGTVPEAHELFAHCDAVLTRADGLTLSIVAIAGREREPSQQFKLSKEALEKIGTDCLRYTGRPALESFPFPLPSLKLDHYLCPWKWPAASAL
jgi:rhomboid protease GluP